MYAPYWNLAESPFQNTPAPRWYHESRSHEEALARLLFVIEQRRACGLLTGVSGTGKSLLLQALARQARRMQREVATLDMSESDSADLLWDLAGSLRLAPAPRQSERDLWRQVQDHLRASQFAHIPTVILADQAEHATPAGLATLRRLLQVGGGNGSVTLIAASRTNSGGLSSLTELADLQVEIEPLTVEEVADYIGHRMLEAGAARTVFQSCAVDVLYESSHGVPREINRLCDLCLVAAAAHELPMIDGRIVTAIVHELELAPTRESRVRVGA